jgi:predicted transcriptional regulator
MRGFGDLEAVLMDRLWSRDEPTSIRELVDELQQEREIAYTTVQTVMDNLHRKGWLSREPRGRAFVYRPVASRQEYSAQLMREALDDGHDADLTLMHFLAQMSDEEAASLRRALRRRPERHGERRAEPAAVRSASVARRPEVAHRQGRDPPVTPAGGNGVVRDRVVHGLGRRPRRPGPGRTRAATQPGRDRRSLHSCLSPP